MGRPTNNPRPNKLSIRISDEDKYILERYCEVEDVNRTEAISRGIKKLIRKEIFIMTDGYEEIDDELTDECCELEDDGFDSDELDVDGQMSKEEMLDEMKERDWEHDLTEESSWEEIKEQYDNMVDEYDNDSDLFPNGRDFDAEDEDGPY